MARRQRTSSQSGGVHSRACGPGAAVALRPRWRSRPPPGGAVGLPGPRADRLSPVAGTPDDQRPVRRRRSPSGDRAQRLGFRRSQRDHADHRARRRQEAVGPRSVGGGRQSPRPDPRLPLLERTAHFQPRPAGAAAGSLAGRSGRSRGTLVAHSRASAPPGRSRSMRRVRSPLRSSGRFRGRASRARPVDEFARCSARPWAERPVSAGNKSGSDTMATRAAITHLGAFSSGPEDGNGL